MCVWGWGCPVWVLCVCARACVCTIPAAGWGAHAGIPTDCPQRERRGWTGDAQFSSEEAMLNYDMQSFYTKYLDDLRDDQLRYNANHLNDTGARKEPNLLRTAPYWRENAIAVPRAAVYGIYVVYHLTTGCCCDSG